MRVCEKFTACSSPNTKKIIASFIDPNGAVRIVVTTVAFGMGIDSPNVRYDTSSTGVLLKILNHMFRKVAVGVVAITCLLPLFIMVKRTSLYRASHATEAMKRYCENMSECRWVLLMRQFTDEALDLPCYPHLCCDVCASVCMCEDCNPDVSFHDQLSESVPFPSSCELSTQDSVTPPKFVQVRLKEQLAEYRESLLSEAYATALVGIELCSGLTDQTIANIATNIHCESDLLKFGVTSQVYYSCIFEIINEVVQK